MVHNQKQALKQLFCPSKSNSRGNNMLETINVFIGNNLCKKSIVSLKISKFLNNDYLFPEVIFTTKIHKPQTHAVVIKIKSSLFLSQSQSPVTNIINYSDSLQISHRLFKEFLTRVVIFFSI